MANETSVASVSVSVVIPCLNEAETIEPKIRSAFRLFADKGSEDGSADLARAAGATSAEGAPSLLWAFGAVVIEA